MDTIRAELAAVRQSLSMLSGLTKDDRPRGVLSTLQVIEAYLKLLRREAEGAGLLVEYELLQTMTRVLADTVT